MTQMSKWPLVTRCTLALVLVTGVFGCQRGDVAFRFNEVEWVKQQQYLAQDETLDERYKEEILGILTSLFGTPDEPDFPIFDEPNNHVNGVVDLENLKLAAGRVKSGRHGEPAGLYREHCVQCHGVSGDGKGPTAAFFTPYPRDFRLGSFKFKSTPLGKRPTDADLAKVIRHGVPGTSMPAFETLEPNEVAALVDYVKYLSIRGQLERRLVAEAESLHGDRLTDTQLVSKIESAPDNERSAIRETLTTAVEDVLEDVIVQRWADADQYVTVVPNAPASFSADHPDHEELVALGRELFRGKANCASCHGKDGLGDGQQKTYDDWTNDWLKTAGVDPKSRKTYQHFLDAGALKPKTISPRNLQLGVFRGGGDGDDIYRRIANGIEGTPMPSALTLNDQEIWALVAFVRELSPE